MKRNSNIKVRRLFPCFLMAVGLLIAQCTAVFAASPPARPDDVELWRQWGKIVKEFYDSKGSYDLDMESDVELMKQFEELKGLDSEEAEHMAYKEVGETEALYYEAIAQGYEVTEEELLNDIEDVEHRMELPESVTYYEAMKEAFASEGDYRDLLLAQRRKQLPIEKYLSDYLKDNREKARVNPGNEKNVIYTGELERIEKLGDELLEKYRIFDGDKFRKQKVVVAKVVDKYDGNSGNSTVGIESLNEGINNTRYSLSVKPEEKFEAGDRVVVLHSGDVLEVYPCEFAEVYDYWKVEKEAS